MQGQVSQDQAGPARWFPPATVASAVVAATAIFAGIAVLIGWLYTRAYYREFGIEPSALSFSLYEYALRAKLALTITLLVFVSMFVGLSAPRVDSLPESHWLRRFLPLAPTSSQEAIALWAMLLVGVGGLCVIGLVDWFTMKSGLYLVPLILGLGLWSALVASWFTRGKRELLAFGLASLIVVVAVLLLYVPGAQGQAEGRKDHDHLDSFPSVSLVAAQELGIPHQESDGAFHKYGPYRLVLRNGGMYYLVAEEEPDDTLAVSEDPITYLQIHNDR